MPQSEDFEPYKILKDAARKVGDFVGSTASKVSTSSGPGPRRTDAEIKAAKARPKEETERQNARALEYSTRNKPEGSREFHGKKPVARKSSRISSRR